MIPDRVVLTTFAGYFFNQILCLRSVQRWLPELPIDIIIDDFDIAHWPCYPQDCQEYIKQNFPTANIKFHRFSDFAGMQKVKTGGWFRQQLVKLYLDQFVSGNGWLLVDSDVVFEAAPKYDCVSATVPDQPTPIDHGNRAYVKHMLACDLPWVVNEQEFWCMSSVPFRYLTRDLLIGLRQHIESIHHQPTFDLHLDLFEQQALVAFDPQGQKMVMSEFQLIEVYRHRYSNEPLPIKKHGASAFLHTSQKDWEYDRAWFEQQHVTVSDQQWQLSQTFGKHRV